MKLNYRIGTLNDKRQLRKLALKAYGTFENVLTKENWEILHYNLQSEKSYTDILSISTCFVCETEDEIIGVAYLVPSGNPTKVFKEDWSYIRMVGVNPDYCGNGIGKTLTKRCIIHAINNGETVIALHTSEFMDAARHVYENLGFKRIREIDPLFGKTYWLYKLEL